MMMMKEKPTTKIFLSCTLTIKKKLFFAATTSSLFKKYYDISWLYGAYCHGDAEKQEKRQEYEWRQDWEEIAQIREKMICEKKKSSASAIEKDYLFCLLFLCLCRQRASTIFFLCRLSSPAALVGYLFTIFQPSTRHHRFSVRLHCRCTISVFNVFTLFGPKYFLFLSKMTFCTVK